MRKEQLAEQYTEGKSSSSVFQEAHKRDFLAGYDTAIEVVAEYLSNTENHHFKDNDFYISSEYLKQTYKFLNEQ